MQIVCGLEEQDPYIVIATMGLLCKSPKKNETQCPQVVITNLWNQMRLDNYSYSLMQVQNLAAQLLTAKHFITPLREKRTIPELEFNAITIGISFIQDLVKSHTIKFDEFYLLTDSAVCFEWINNEIAKLSIYLKNRMPKILNCSIKPKIFWINAELQAADYATKINSVPMYTTDNEWFKPKLFGIPESLWPVLVPPQYSANFTKSKRTIMSNYISNFLYIHKHVEIGYTMSETFYHILQDSIRVKSIQSIVLETNYILYLEMADLEFAHLIETELLKKNFIIMETTTAYGVGIRTKEKISPLNDIQHQSRDNSSSSSKIQKKKCPRIPPVSIQTKIHKKRYTENPKNESTTTPRFFRHAFKDN